MRSHAHFFLIGGIATALVGAVSPVLATPPTKGGYSGMRSWQSLRDANLVRQSLDYSCGASSIATLLTYHFRQPTTEIQVLAKLPAVDRPYSLTDIQAALRTLGYDSIALRGDFLTLQALNNPAIIYLHPRRTRTTVGHFVVLRSVGPENVVAADPAVGTRTYSKSEFLDIWLGTRNLKSRTGVFLLVRLQTQHPIPLPDEENTAPDTRPQPFFWKGGQQRRFRPPQLL